MIESITATPPEGVKKLLSIRLPGENWGQGICNLLKSRSERDWIPAFAGMT